MSDKLLAATHGARVEDRLRLHAPHSDYEALMVDAANEITALREGFAELAAIAKEWDGESGRAELYAKSREAGDPQRRLSMQRAMLLHHHAAAIEGCIDRATR